MAAITTGGSGLWSSVTVNAPWSTGVPPVEGDSVTIALGHTVTVDGTYTAGDDSATAFQINGTLKASRAVNSSLTIKGLIQTAAATTAAIDYGKSSDPIPSTVTATLILNKSASMANWKYGLLIGDGSGAWFYGSTKSVNTTLVNQASSGATSFVVADGTGWAVGDTVVIAETSGTATDYDIVSTVTSVTPGAGTTATIGCAALGKTHAAGGPVGNFTTNVTVKNYDNSTSTYICFRAVTTASNSQREVQYTNFQRVSSNNAQTATQVFLSGAGVAIESFIALSHNAFYQCGLGQPMFLHQAISTLQVRDTVFFHTSGSSGGGACVYFSSGTNMGLDSSLMVYCAGNALQSAFSQGGQANQITNNKFWACASYGGAVLPGSGLTFSGNQYHSISNTNAAAAQCGSGSATYRNESFGSSDLPGTPNIAYVFQESVGGYGAAVMTDCKFGTPTSGFVLSQTQMSPLASLTVINKNQDSTQQEYWTKYIQFVRDNAVFNRGRQSLAAKTLQSGASSRTIQIPADSGVAVTVIGYLRKNSSYGGSTLPTVSLSGLGITPVTFTMTNSVDTWEKFTLTATHTAGYSSYLTFTFTAQSTSAAGIAYCDGVADVPFVSWVQHYGYTYDPTNPKRTVDSVVQLSEAAASALTGISYAAGTLTISGTRSIREVYDWLKWYEASNQLDPIITSVDGVNFALDANLTLSGSLTGSGTLALGSNTFSGSGSTTVVITFAAGAYVPLSITGISNGSRVQVYNVDTATEVYNGVPGTSLALSASWTTNQSLRIRAAKLGLLPYVVSATLTATGTVVVLAQQTDTVYVDNAVDGSTVTEFTADYPNIQVDISDPDGVTTLARLYAWAQYNTTTSSGIANFFDAITATDTANYIVDVAVVDLKLDNVSASPVRVIGGYLSRNDSTTVIAATSGSIQMDPSKAYLAGDATDSLNNLALLHGLSTGNPLRVSASRRTAGTLVQTINDDGITVTVTRTA